MKNAECSMPPDGVEKRCCPMQFLLSALAVFIVMFIFEGLFHGVFMMPYYKATASLWRPEVDMQNHMMFGVIRQIGTALAFTCLFTCMMKKTDCGVECPIKIGGKFGFKIGLILGLSMFGAYAWLPLPSLEIPLLWLAGNIILGTLMGMTLGIICKCKMKKKAADAANGDTGSKS